MVNYFFFFCVLFCVSCASIKPDAPELIEVKRVKVKKVSQIKVPIVVNLSRMIKENERNIPLTFQDEKTKCEGVSYAYLFNRNPIEIEGHNNELLAFLSGKYGVSVSYCPKCHDFLNDEGNCVVPRVKVSCGINEPMRKIKLVTATSIHISPDYELDAKTVLKELDTPDKCEVTLFKYDATELLVTELKKALLNATVLLDKEIEATDVKKEVEKIWISIQEPIALSDFGFFSLNPLSLSISTPVFEKENVFFSVVMSAEPSIHLSKVESKVVKLPPLSESGDVNGFSTSIDVKGAYAEINKLLKTHVAGQTIRLKKNSIVLDSVFVLGAVEKQLAFKVCFSGDKKGFFYLLGTPVFNKEKQEVSFPDLTFDMHTRNILLKSAKWLFDDLITEKIRQAAKYSLLKDLKEIKQTIQKELNRNLDMKTSMSTKIDRLYIDGVYPSNECLLIEVFIDGDMKIDVH